MPDVGSGDAPKVEYLIVNGHVRKGVTVERTGYDESGVLQPCANDLCHLDAEWLYLSAKGLRTYVCDDCRVSCGEPQPKEMNGLKLDSYSAVRTLIAGGFKFQDGRMALNEAEKYEKAKKRWDRAIRPHGFKRVKADPNKRKDKGLWSPY